MEMPIKVMITLFVALIVAVIIVNFAADAITDAKSKITEYGSDDVGDEGKIIEVVEVNSRQLGVLAKNCYDRNKEEIENELCFLVMGDVTASESDVVDISGLEEEQIVVDLSEAENAVKVKYNAALGKVEITG